MEWFAALNAVLQALLATMFTWVLAAAGAATVFVIRSIDRRILDSMMGFAAGVMIAAGFWSLLLPAMAVNEGTGGGPWLPVTIGFAAGGAFLLALDRVLPHLHLGFPREAAEGVDAPWKRSVLVVLAMALHNVPEGLAVGIVFGAVAGGVPGATIGGAVALAIGIAVQNVPEGACVAVPLRREGMRARRAFWYGHISGAVEPVAGMIGAAVVLLVPPLIPYALGFVAGGMFFVVVEEVIPESQLARHTDFATAFTLVGFIVMMLLDLALG